MPRERVLKSCCARCTKVWYSSYDPTEPDKKHKDALVLEFCPDSTHDTSEQLSVMFDILCANCTRAVANYLSSVLREPKKKDEETAEGGDSTKSVAKEEVRIMQPSSPERAKAPRPAMSPSSSNSR